MEELEIRRPTSVHGFPARAREWCERGAKVAAMNKTLFDDLSARITLRRWVMIACLPPASMKLRAARTFGPMLPELNWPEIRRPN